MDTHARYTVETRAGRLIEARVFSLRTRADADDYSSALAREVQRHDGRDAPVLLADHRPIPIYPQPVTERLVELFQQMNARLERIAIIAAPTNATLLLQLERLVREAGYENRRVVRDAQSALDHLAPSLDAAEKARARAFLLELR